MNCILCKKEIVSGSKYKTVHDAYFTHINQAHISCWFSFKRWMQIHQDKELLVFLTCMDSTVTYSDLNPDAPPIPYSMYQDEFETLAPTSYGRIPRMTEIDEWWTQQYNPEYEAASNKYNHPGSHGPDIDWYGEQGTARWEVEPV